MLSLIAPICVVLLGAIFLFTTEATEIAKVLVGGFVLLSLAVRFLLPGLELFVLLFQVIVSIGILLYLKVNR